MHRCPAHPMMKSQIHHIYKSYVCENTIISVFRIKTTFILWIFCVCQLRPRLREIEREKAALRQNALDINAIDCIAETLHRQLGLFVTADSPTPKSDHSATLHRKTKHPSMSMGAFPLSLAKLHSSLYLHRCLEYVHTAQGHTNICTRDVLTWHKQKSHLSVNPPTHIHTHIQMEI